MIDAQSMFASAGHDATSWSIGNITGWNMKRATNMSSMFSYAGYNATNFNLDLSGWETPSGDNLSYMFQYTGYNATTNYNLNISGWKVPNATNLSNMFRYAGYKSTNLISLDLSGFNTSSATNMTNMFANMRKLAEVKLGAGFTFNGNGSSRLTSLPTPSATYIPGADGYWYNKETMEGYAPSEVPNATAATYTTISPIKAIYSLDDNSLRFYKTTEEIGSTYKGKTVTNVYKGFDRKTFTQVSDLPWYDIRESIVSISVEDELALTSTAYVFSGLKNAVEIDVSKLDTSTVTNMSNMFARAGYRAGNFQILGLNNLDTSEVTNMSSMFTAAGFYASSFELDLSNFDTANVTNMSNMFTSAGHQSNEFTIDVSNFNTSKVTDMYGMFSYAGLKATDWSIGDLSTKTVSGETRWDVSKVEDMSEMFCEAGKSTTNWWIGDLKDWNTAKVQDLSFMFNGSSSNAKNDIHMDLSTWNTSSVTQMWYVFTDTNIKTLNLANWDTKSVEEMYSMFDGMYKLQEITLGANFTFNGTQTSRQCELPTPSSDHIEGASGYWYNTANERFEADAIPNETADTYTAIAQQVLVTFNRNTTSTDTETLEQTFIYDVDNQTFIANEWTKTGYTLSGYSINRNATSATYAVNYVANNEFISTHTPSCTLYAIWKPNEYVVTFEPTGGTVSPTTKTVKYDSTYGELPVPTREGYEFLGWFTELDGETQILATDVVDETAENQTLYAMWRESKYTIYFDLNTGLPNGYTLLDYIESTGTQYIDTGIANDNVSLFKTELKVSYNTTSPTNQIMGFTGNRGMGIGTAGSTWWEATNPATVTANSVYNLVWTKQGTSFNRIINGNENAGTGVTAQSYTGKLYLFATVYSDSNPNNITHYCQAKLYSAKIYVDDILVRNFIPCKNPDGVIGLYDTVEGKFYENAGTGTFNGTEAISEIETSKEVINGNAYGTLPSPIRIGYDLAGWFTQATGGTQITSETIVTTDAKDQTLYAQWSPKKYTITATAGAGGMITPASVNVKHGGNYTFKIIPSAGYAINEVLVDGTSIGAKDTYTFTNVTSTHTIQATFVSQGYEFTLVDTLEEGTKYLIVSNNIALKNSNGSVGAATVTINNNTIVTNDQTIIWTYENGRLSNNSTGSTLNLYGSGSTLSLKTNTTEAYTRVSYTSPLFRLGNSLYYLCRYRTSSWRLRSSSTATAIYDTNIYIYALVDYTVTFDSNGIANGTLKQGFKAGKAQNLLANQFAKEGYTFNGWATTQTGEVTYADEASYTATADTTLYAKWLTDYTVTFDANGGTGTMEPQGFAPGIPEKINPNLFNNGNYLFAGWSTTPNGPVEYENNANYTATDDATLYAVWVEGVNYTVQHWQQTLTGGDEENNTNYVLMTSDTEILKGIPNGSVTPSTKTYTGFDSPTKQTVTVYEDGSTIVNYYYKRQYFYLDLNAVVNGTTYSNTSGYGSADIYVNGELVANDVTDFWQQYRYGSTYEYKDIKATSISVYNGLNSQSTAPLSGTVTGPVYIYLDYTAELVDGYISLKYTSHTTTGEDSDYTEVSSHHGGTITASELTSYGVEITINGTRIDFSGLKDLATGSVVIITVTSGATATHTSASATYTITIGGSTVTTTPTPTPTPTATATGDSGGGYCQTCGGNREIICSGSVSLTIEEHGVGLYGCATCGAAGYSSHSCYVGSCSDCDYSVNRCTGLGSETSHWKDCPDC